MKHIEGKKKLEANIARKRNIAKALRMHAFSWKHSYLK